MNKVIFLSLLLASMSPTVLAEYVPYVDPAAPGGAYSATSPTQFETVPEGEAGQIAELIALTTKLEEKRYGDRLARRGVHPKDHGCLKAAFTINGDIPERYRVGVFAEPGKKYDAWVRFSNATAIVTPDMIDTRDGTGKESTSRGMAIKLMKVEGSTLLNAAGGKTQDFLLINQPMFAFPNVSEYLELTKIQLANNEVVDRFFAPPRSAERDNTLKIIAEIRATKLGSPLETAYFSASPFLYGNDSVAKFSVMPRDPTTTPVPTDPAPNYLREALKKSLDVKDGKPVVFDFRVQLRTDESLPVENAAQKWPEDVAPFQNVATVAIEPQHFDEPLRITECEHLVFTPWHGLVEHRPLGGINRLRLGVYTASAQFRAQAFEPSSFPGN